MGERCKSKIVERFTHGSDAAYADLLANSDLLSGCRTEIVSTEYVVYAGGAPRPPVGAEVLLMANPAGISAVVGTQPAGTVDKSDATELNAVLVEVGGVLRAKVTRLSSVGDYFNVAVQLDDLV